MIEEARGESHHRMKALIVKISAPVLVAAKRGGLAAQMPVEVAPGKKDRRQFSALEAVGRLLCGLSALLEREMLDGAVGAIDISDVHNLIGASVDPDGPHKLNFSDGLQPLVDAAFLAQAVLRAPHALWTSLSPDIQRNLVDALHQARKIEPYYNNWLLFSATIEAMLAKIGEPWDPVRIDYALRQHELWYAGDGIYKDGPHLRWDYYNGYVIQPMLSDILSAVGAVNPHWQSMRVAHSSRMARYAVVLERLIGPDGSFPPIGRSLAYRCAAFQPLAQLALHGELPAALPPAQVRCALEAVIRRTLDAPENFDQEGWLRLGLNGSQPNMAEGYISTGSLYLCSTAFLPLGLPSEAPFWSDAAMPWSQRSLWAHGQGVAIDKAMDM
ncbi:DUF2264 domain-containing protein [Sphingomonas bisphenolicum]|nr:DUF2264 domain-containing protein [Sphingomonas bisphenolicum]